MRGLAVVVGEGHGRDGRKELSQADNLLVPQLESPSFTKTGRTPSREDVAWGS